MRVPFRRRHQRPDLRYQRDLLIGDLDRLRVVGEVSTEQSGLFNVLVDVLNQRLNPQAAIVDRLVGPGNAMQLLQHLIGGRRSRPYPAKYRQEDQQRDNRPPRATNNALVSDDTHPARDEDDGGYSQ